jgi:hypothetical protein
MKDQESTAGTKYPDQMPIWCLYNASFPDQENVDRWVLIINYGIGRADP